MAILLTLPFLAVLRVQSLHGMKAPVTWMPNDLVMIQVITSEG